MNDRTNKIGRLFELKQQRKDLRTELDAFAKAICVHFDIMDQDFMYTDNIDSNKLQSYVNSIRRNKTALDRVNVEIVALAKELNMPVE